MFRRILLGGWICTVSRDVAAEDAVALDSPGQMCTVVALHRGTGQKNRMRGDQGGGRPKKKMSVILGTYKTLVSRRAQTKVP